MYLLGSRWLAWALRLVTDVALAAWLLMLAWVLVLMVQQHSASGGVRQGSVYSELKLPPEIVEVSDSSVSVFNFEASRLRVHYRTAEKSTPWETVRVIGGVAAWWGIFALVLWQLRQILSSFVRRAPLTLDNARRFRLISYLLVLGAAVTSLVRSLEYLKLEPIFPMLPSRGFMDLYLGHLEWSRLFSAMLVLLLAEAVRLGAEHRIDSESVV